MKTSHRLLHRLRRRFGFTMTQPIRGHLKRGALIAAETCSPRVESFLYVQCVLGMGTSEPREISVFGLLRQLRDKY